MHIELIQTLSTILGVDTLLRATCLLEVENVSTGLPHSDFLCLFSLPLELEKLQVEFLVGTAWHKVNRWLLHLQLSHRSSVHGLEALAIRIDFTA